MPSAKKLNSFNSIIRQLEKLTPSGAKIETLNICQTPAGEYPLLKIVLGEGSPRRALISAGIHGDEPGGVETILNFLKEGNFSPFINEWEITLLPCINPYGYEFGSRENHQGKDLNRLFKIDEPPLEVTFVQSILDTCFELTIELHEDNDSQGYYLYQKGVDSKNDEIGLRILKSIEDIMPINLESEIDGSPSHQGIIGKELNVSAMDWWPMALYGLSKGTQMCLTLEAAGRYELSRRVKAHLAAIRTAFCFFKN